MASGVFLLCGQALVGAPPPVGSAGSPAPPDSHLAARNIVCDCPETLESEHFVANWGELTTVERAGVSDLLDAFEQALSVQVDELGYPAPFGSDAYKFNVYIGNSGMGAPATAATGYTWTDEDGYPYIVVNRQSLNVADFTEPLAAHEFMHALQMSTGNYPFSEHKHRWFWEAHAQYAAGRVFPEQWGYAGTLTASAYLPHLAVDFYDADAGGLAAVHHYGTFPWMAHLADSYGDELLRDAWTTAAPASDPTEGLRATVAAAGGDLDQDWLDHLERNVTWDYPLGDIYSFALEQQGPAYPDEAENVVAMEIASDEGWHAGPDDLRPFRYGHNRISVTPPDARFVGVDLRGDAAGSEGSSSQLAGRLLATVDGEAVWSEPLIEEEGVFTASAELSGDEDLWLIVGAWTESAEHRKTETFSYEVRSAEGRGCGCSQGGRGLPAALLLLLLPVLLRRPRCPTTATPSSKH